MNPASCPSCGRPINMQSHLAEADGHLYVLCPFCISKQHIPIIEIESNPGLHDVVRKTKRVSVHCHGNGDTPVKKKRLMRLTRPILEPGSPNQPPKIEV